MGCQTAPAHEDCQPTDGEYGPSMAPEPQGREGDARHGCHLRGEARRGAAEADGTHLLRRRALRLRPERNTVFIEVPDRSGTQDLQARLGRAQSDQHADRSDHLTKEALAQRNMRGWWMYAFLGSLSGSR